MGEIYKDFVKRRQAKLLCVAQSPEIEQSNLGRQTGREPRLVWCAGMSLMFGWLYVSAVKWLVAGTAGAQIGATICGVLSLVPLALAVAAWQGIWPRRARS